MVNQIKDFLESCPGINMLTAMECLAFQANKCAQCQQAIMVLSDGTTSSLSDLFKEHNPDKKVGGMFNEG